MTHIGGLDVLGASDPFDFIAAFLDRVDQGSNVSRHVVEQVDGRFRRHGSKGWQETERIFCDLILDKLWRGRGFNFVRV